MSLETASRRAACPRCASILVFGTTHGAVSPADSETVCDSCGSVLWIDSMLTLRRMDVARWHGLSQHEREALSAMQRAVRARVAHLTHEDRRSASRQVSSAARLTTD